MDLLNTKPALRKDLILLSVPFCLIGFEVILSFTRLFQKHTVALSAAMTFDLIFAIPLIYFLLSRKDNNKLATTFLFTAGIIIAGFIIPKNQQFYLKEVKFWIVPIIEIISVTLIVIKVNAVLKEHRINGAHSTDFYTTLKTISSQVLPKKLGLVLAYEIGVFYYGLFCWKRPVFNQRSFSYHKKSNSVMLIGVFIFLIMVECAALHFLLMKWNVKIALLLTILSVYTALQLFGMARAMTKRPIEIIKDCVFIPYGLFAQTTIRITDILEIELSTKQLDVTTEIKKISPLKTLEDHNTIIRLNNDGKIEGLYGKEKSFTTLLLHIDESVLFRDEVYKQLEILTGIN